MAVIALAGPPALLLVDTAAALMRGWRCDARLDLLGGALVLGILVAVAIVRVLSRGRVLLAHFAPQICLASLATIFSLVAAELAIQMLLPGLEPPVHLRQPSQHALNRLAPGVMRGITGESRTVINSQGVRGSEMPAAANRYAVVCLGGSSTNCTYLDQSETWPAVLEQNLQAANPVRQCWVGNVGIPSLATHEHLKFLNESSLPKQVDCVIVQAGINDFMQAIAPQRPTPPYWTRSQLWRLINTVARRYLNSVDILVEDDAGASYVRRRAQRSAADKATTLPDLQEPLADYVQRFRAIIARCKELGVRLVVTSQPVLWTTDANPENEKLFWFGRTGSNQYLATPPLREGMDEYNRATRQACEELDVEFIDLAEFNGRDEIFYDDCHFTEEGARQVARRIADYLLAHPAPKGGKAGSWEGGKRAEFRDPPTVRSSHLPKANP